MTSNVICKVVFGSHLYRLNTSNSDTDYKGILMPTKSEILLGFCRYHKSFSTGKEHEKNTAQDIDFTSYSLAYFVDLACKGETVALDMLHSSPEDWLESSPVWEYLVANRAKFYTRNMKSYYGYVMKQAAKYGIRGSKVAALEQVINLLEKFQSINSSAAPIKLFEIRGELPLDEHCKFVDGTNGELFYEVCGSKYGLTSKIEYVLESVNNHYAAYGERARLAKENSNIDFKSVSHALRGGYQIRSILQHGTFSYPLAESDFLMSVKLGQADYMTEVEPALHALLDEIATLTEASTLPNTIDTSFWNDFVQQTHYDIVVKP